MFLLFRLSFVQRIHFCLDCCVSVYISLLLMMFEILEPCRVLRLGTSSKKYMCKINKKIMIKIKIEKKKWNEWNGKENKKEKKKASKEKGGKRENKLSSWKTNMLLKRDDFQLFFEKNSFIDHNWFLKKKRVYTWRVNAMKISPDAQNDLEECTNW